MVLAKVGRKRRECTIGQGSAFVYNESCGKAFAASEGLNLYSPSGSVRIAAQ
jgi:hypothetical protein